MSSLAGVGRVLTRHCGWTGNDLCGGYGHRKRERNSIKAPLCGSAWRLDLTLSRFLSVIRSQRYCVAGVILGRTSFEARDFEDLAIADRGTCKTPDQSDP